MHAGPDVDLDLRLAGVGVLLAGKRLEMAPAIASAIFDDPRRALLAEARGPFSLPNGYG
jgi:hypothetical protein